MSNLCGANELPLRSNAGAVANSTGADRWAVLLSAVFSWIGRIIAKTPKDQQSAFCWCVLLEILMC